MEETKKLTIPDGCEFNRVENGEVILKKKELVLPKTFGECNKGIGMSCFPSINWCVPNENENAIRALCELLICRNAWWKVLGWKPDLEGVSFKYIIGTWNGNVETGIKCCKNYILSFPTEEVRDQFFKTFRDLIEEAKELL